jgi:hypothetical protein
MYQLHICAATVAILTSSLSRQHVAASSLLASPTFHARLPSPRSFVPQGLDPFTCKHFNWCRLHHGEDDCAVCYQSYRGSRPGARSQCRTICECRIEDLFRCTAVSRRTTVRTGSPPISTLLWLTSVRRETAAEENSTAYFPLLDRIADGYFDKAQTDEALYTSFRKLLQEDVFLRSCTIHALCCAEARSPLPILQNCYTTNIWTRG